MYKVVSSDENSITLESPVDPRRGLQISRKIELLKDESRVKISAELRNLSTVSKRWSIWPVAQLARTSGDCEASVPIGTSDWKIMHGVVNNPQYFLDGDILRVKYKRIVGKVGALTPSGWVAFLDNSNGRLFAVSFDFAIEAEYPDSTSVQVWTSGLGSVYSRGRLLSYAENETENPPYTELEVLSPLSDIPPGSSTNFEYCLGACSIPAGKSVRKVDPACAIAQPLHRNSNGLVEFEAGFFKEGRIEFKAIKNSESKSILESPCSPLSPICSAFAPPEGVEEISAVFCDNFKNSETIDSIKI